MVKFAKYKNLKFEGTFLFCHIVHRSMSFKNPFAKVHLKQLLANKRALGKNITLNK